MKKPVILFLGIIAFTLQTGSAQTLFTTENDFASGSSSSYTGTPTSSVDLDGSTINGLGNTTAPGATGTAGADSLTWLSGTFDYMYFSPGEQGNAPFISALEHASSLTFDYTTPAAGTGTFFQLGVVLNYQGGFDQLFGSTVSLGGGVTQETISFTSEAATLISNQATDGGTFSYFQMGVIYNSNYNAAGSPFTVDDFAVTPAPTPEPSSLALFGFGALGLLKFARRRQD